MDILISVYGENTELIFKNVKNYFSQQFPDEEFEWKQSGTIYTTTMQTGEQKIAEVFEELIKEYPELYVEAYYSYDVREGDNSAQWWGTTKIYSEKNNGKTEIVASSSTYWN